MPRGFCYRHGQNRPCSCAMGNIYRFLEPLVLYLLKKQGRTYGYELLGAIQCHALTDSTVEPGALYRTLRKLEINGFVESIWNESTIGPARRTYKLTENGKNHLSEWVIVIQHMSESMLSFVQDADKLLHE